MDEQDKLAQLWKEITLTAINITECELKTHRLNSDLNALEVEGMRLGKLVLENKNEFDAGEAKIKEYGFERQAYSDQLKRQLEDIKTYIASLKSPPNFDIPEVPSSKWIRNVANRATSSSQFHPMKQAIVELFYVVYNKISD